MRKYNNMIRQEPMTLLNAFKLICTPECYNSCFHYKLMLVFYTKKVESYNQSLWICTGKTEILTDRTPMLVIRPISTTTTTDGTLWLQHSEQAELDMGTAVPDPETPVSALISTSMKFERVAFEPFWSETSIVGKLINQCDAIWDKSTLVRVRTNHHSRPVRVEMWIEL